MDENSKLPFLKHPEQNDEILKSKGVSLCAFLDTVRKRKDNTYSIRIRIIFERFPKLYSTKINLTKKDYESIVFTNPRGKLKETKITIYKLLKNAYDIIEDIDEFGFEKFDKKYRNKVGAWENVYFAFTSQITDLNKDGNIGTASVYQTAFNSIKKFHKKDKLLFKDVDVNFLVKYEKWMKRNNKSSTTISINTRCLRRLFNIAIKKGDVKKEFYPFGDEKEGFYKPIEASNNKRALTNQELDKLFKYAPEKNTPEDFYKDLFIFSYLGNGININDIARLKYSNINNGEIEFERTKTKSKRKIKKIIFTIDEDIQSIIEKHGTKPVQKENFIFKILTKGLTPQQETAKIKQATKQCNKYLKRIACEIGINEDISTYYARHSFASMLKDSGESIEFISESLGHSNIIVTENYLNSFKSDKRKETQKKLKNFNK